MMLHITIIRIATTAINQLAEQLSIADCESVSPIAIMIGPVTIGGKNFITLSVPKVLKRAARTRQKEPQRLRLHGLQGRQHRDIP